MAVATREPGAEVRSASQVSRTSRLLIIAASTVVVGVGIPLLSTALGLYDRVEHWGKLVHAVDGACAALVFSLLLLGWRDYESVAFADQLAATLAACSGVFFGVMWETVEFVLDWVRDTDLQKSNADTMTDLLWNDVGVVIGVAIALEVYCRWATLGDRASIGAVAEWLVDGPSRLLQRHGFLITLIVAAVAGIAITALWFTGRPVPGFPIS